MQFLITGGAGFVGANLIRKLLLHPTAEVSVVVKADTDLWRLKDIRKHPRLHVHQLDLLDQKKLHRLLHRLQPKVIYHLAARGAYPDQNDPHDIMAGNITSTLNLLEASRAIPYKLFVNVGSSSEYGFKSRPMKESDICEPNSLYAASKLAATNLCSLYAHQDHKPIVTVRLFSVYGPYEEPSRLFPTMIRKITSDQSLSLADPAIARDFVFVNDVVDFLVSKRSQLAAHPGEVFNLGTGKQSTLKKVVSVLTKISGKKIETHWGEYPARSWDTQTWVADTRKTMESLQWQPRYDLEKGIQTFWHWYQDNGIVGKDG